MRIDISTEEIMEKRNLISSLKKESNLIFIILIIRGFQKKIKSSI
jgi:hypothetical protein